MLLHVHCTQTIFGVKLNLQNRVLRHLVEQGSAGTRPAETVATPLQTRTFRRPGPHDCAKVGHYPSRPALG